MEQAINFAYNGQDIKRNVVSFLNNIWPKEFEERITNPPKNEEGGLPNILTIIKGDNQELSLELFKQFRIQCNSLGSSEDTSEDSSSLSLSM